MSDSKTVGVRIPNWMYDEMIGSENHSISERIKELITKGFLYEQKQSNVFNENKKDSNAVSEIASRDYRGIAGFPELAVN